MAKSVNEYYSEKMKRLLEMQAQNGAHELSSPQQSRAVGQSPAKKRPEVTSAGRGYYEKFRSDVKGERAGAVKSQTQSRPKSKRPQNPLERNIIDDVRKGRAPGRGVRGDSAGARQNDRQRAQEKSRTAPPRKRINPEQTARDKYEENLRRIEAMRTAKRARVLRKVRDGVVSFVLIAAVFVVMCIVVYRLLFVINDISAVGGVSNTSEELVLASGVKEGDHLFSFSSREVGDLMTLRCPEVAEVDVERTPPGTIVFNVVEEEPAFYADFYGEYRLLSGTLRVMDSVTEEDAKNLGCIKIKLPDVYNATAGLTPEFSSVRNDDYLYEVCRALLASELGARTGSMDVSDKYNLTLGVDGKYIIKLGDSESIETKLNIAAAVLKDEMFRGETKATIDVQDLSETSVVVDNGLIVE